MAFSLIDDAVGAVPITALTKDQLSMWSQTAPERERTGLGRPGLPPKPASSRWCRTSRASSAGCWSASATARRRCGPSPGFPTRCRRAATGRLAARGRRPDPGRARLGARHLRLHPLPRQKPRAGRGWSGRKAPTAAWSSGWPRAVSSPATWSTPRPRHGPGGTGGRPRSTSPRRPAPATASSSATSCSPRTTRRSMPSAAPARGRRGSSTSSGATSRRPR